MKMVRIGEDREMDTWIAADGFLMRAYSLFLPNGKSLPVRAVIEFMTEAADISRTDGVDHTHVFAHTGVHSLDLVWAVREATDEDELWYGYGGDKGHPDITPVP